MGRALARYTNAITALVISPDVAGVRIPIIITKIGKNLRTEIIKQNVKSLILSTDQLLYIFFLPSDTMLPKCHKSHQCSNYVDQNTGEERPQENMIPHF